MSRFVKAAPLLIPAINLLLPLGSALCRLLGLELVLILPRTIMAIETALILMMTIVRRRAGTSVPRCLVAELLTPVAAAVNVFCFTMAKNGLQSGYTYSPSLDPWLTADVVWTVLLGLVLFVCSMRFNPPFPARFGVIAAKLLLWLVPAFLCIVWLLFYLVMGNFGFTYVAPEIPSPDGAYIAQATVNDGGALGGNTRLKVRQAGKVHLGMAAVRRAPIVDVDYDWRPIEEVELEWIDGDTLVFEGDEYSVDPRKE